MTSPAAGDTDAPERCLREVWRELTRRGLVMDRPRAGTCTCCTHGLRRAQRSLDLLAGGAMVWEFIPVGGTVIPGQVARMVWALPGGDAGPGQLWAASRDAHRCDGAGGGRPGAGQPRAGGAAVPSRRRGWCVTRDRDHQPGPACPGGCEHRP
jgi:hypothetical protein